MFLPIGDEPNDHTRVPFVTWGLIGLNVLILVVMSTQGLGEGTRAGGAFYRRWGYVAGDGHPETLITHQFLHGGWVHVIGNMLFLWIFGDNVESRLGHVGFLAAYLATGAAAGGVQGMFAAGDGLPLVGASGAVSGVEGLYWVACPGARVRMLIWFYVFLRVVLVPARLLIVAWFLLQDVLPLLVGHGLTGDNVGHFAHLGGFAAGLLLMLGLLPVLGRHEPPPRLSVDERYPRRAFRHDRLSQRHRWSDDDV